ncbi:DUF6702 family protein [Sandarakinorhabdus sp. AAP62]|uniref:DUF6702 family protein n=1 Tax=Sandarakinorhabdus sp. AAP62 TaxID=1248916 RepID=UPI000305CE94|nr:DUF6702 family protein [Sandarakinorhabdus sp. AAP62]
MRLLAAIALLLAVPAAAHRGHASLAVVEIDARSGAVSVTHHLQAHDVEPALVDIAPDAQPSLDDPDALQALVAYVGQRFRISGVRLAPAGQTLAGDTVLLRYIGRLKGRPKTVLIAGALFGETWDDHSTQVNVRRGGLTRTLQFRPGDPEKPVNLASD